MKRKMFQIALLAVSLLTLLGTVSAQIAILYLYRFENYSRSVFIIDAALLILLLSGTRASFRLMAEFMVTPVAPMS